MYRNSSIAFIPVRGGSKSVPRKNIKDFCGKPLVYWALLACEKCPEIDRVYVSTEDDEIKSVVSSLGFSKVNIHDRPVDLAQDETSTEDVMFDFLNKVEVDPMSIFVLVQATNPFLKSTDLTRAVSTISKGESDSLISVVRSKHFMWSPEGEPLNYDFRNRPRRQDFKGQFIENGSFYISRVDNILKNQNRLSGKIGICEMAEESLFDIDEEIDWMVAEFLFQRVRLT